MTISVQGIDLIVPKVSGKIANLGEQMLMKKIVLLLLIVVLYA